EHAAARRDRRDAPALSALLGLEGHVVADGELHEVAVFLLEPSGEGRRPLGAVGRAHLPDAAGPLDHDALRGAHASPSSSSNDSITGGACIASRPLSSSWARASGQAPRRCSAASRVAANSRYSLSTWPSTPSSPMRRQRRNIRYAPQVPRGSPGTAS